MERIGRALAADVQGLRVPALRIALPERSVLVAVRPPPERFKTREEAEKERVTALVKSVEGTIYNFIKRYATSTDHAADLTQEARLGVLRAAQLWRPSSAGGTANFNSYAVNWIRAFVFRYLKAHNSLVQRTFKGGEVRRDASLNAPYDAANENGEEWLDHMVDEVSLPLDVALEKKEISAAVACKLERIRFRLGAVGWDLVQNRLMHQISGRGKDADTLETVGERHGISRERVRQIELRSLKFLRRYLAEFQTEVDEGADNDKYQSDELLESRLR